MRDIVDELRQGAINNEDYRWRAADEIVQNRIDLEEYRKDIEEFILMFEWIKGLTGHALSIYVEEREEGKEDEL